MSGFFNMDNPFFRAMRRVADLMILNVIFVICCIPIVTIGPALTGLFYTTLKMVRNEESYIVRGFFHSFKQNLRQGIIINLIMLVSGVLLWLDLQIVQTRIGGTMGSVMVVVFAVLAIIYLMTFIYVYPVLSRFYNTIKNTFINALLMSIRHLPYTVLMIAITIMPVGILFLPAGMTAAQSVLLLLLILMGFATIAYCNSFFLVKILDNYMPKEEEENKGAADEDSAADLSVEGSAGNLTFADGKLISTEESELFTDAVDVSAASDTAENNAGTSINEEETSDR